MNYYGKIVEKLNDLKILYCIARNYQNHPEYGGDLDLFVAPSDVQFVIDIMNEVCDEVGSSMLLQSPQFSSYVTRSQKIYVFYIMDKRGVKMHQIDLFMGFSLWGVCVINSNTIVESRVWDKNGFFKMNPNDELMIKYFQIQSYKSLNNVKKVESYRSQLIELLSVTSAADTTSYRNELIDFYENKTFPSFHQVLKNRLILIKEGLKYHNFSLFSRLMYKLYTLARVHKHVILLNTNTKMNEIQELIEVVSDNGFYRKYYLTTNLGIFLNIRKVISTVERGGIVFVANNNKNKNSEVSFEKINDLVVENLLSRCVLLANSN